MMILMICMSSFDIPNKVCFIIICISDNTLKLLYFSALCLLNNGGCQHRCVESFYSHYCACNTGYMLNSDQETCSCIHLILQAATIIASLTRH